MARLDPAIQSNTLKRQSLWPLDGRLKGGHGVFGVRIDLNRNDSREGRNGKAERVFTAVKAGSAYFGIVFGAGFVLGVLRYLVVAPAVGERTAVLIEMPVILAVSWVVSRWLVGWFGVRGALGPRLVMGAVAFGVLMGAEAGLAVFGFGRTLAQHIAGYRETTPLIGLLGQMVFGLIPVIQLWRR